MWRRTSTRSTDWVKVPSGEPTRRNTAPGPKVVGDLAHRPRPSGGTLGDGPSSSTNVQGPGRSSGVHGPTDSVYFHDPSGNILEILTYDSRG